MWTRVTNLATWDLILKKNNTCHLTATWASMTCDLITWTQAVWLKRLDLPSRALCKPMYSIHIGALQVLCVLFCVWQIRFMEITGCAGKAHHLLAKRTAPLSSGIYLANVITHHSQQTKARALNRNVTAAYTWTVGEENDLTSQSDQLGYWQQPGGNVM